MNKNIENNLPLPSRIIEGDLITEIKYYYNNQGKIVKHTIKKI